MYENLNQLKDQLPPEYRGELLTTIREEFIASGKTIVVLDDDPTGTQTCYDVTVLISWQVALITEELKKKPAILFILTNSRSLPEPQAVALTQEIGSNLKEAVKASGQEIVLISRSDSTLRGHFPAEVDAIAEELGMEEAVTILVPAFIEGGRITIHDIHYLVENDKLIPVSETPFAKDVAFGYQHANLNEWVEEKTRGRVNASDVTSLSIDTIRIGGPEAVSVQLKNCVPGSVCIANAVSYKDLEVIVMGLLLAEKSGKTFLYRTSATIVPIRSGMESGKPFVPKKLPTASGHGGMVVVGSYVPKTTSQLAQLLESDTYSTVEVDVTELLNSAVTRQRAAIYSQQIEAWLSAGKNVVVYTSRQQEVGHDPESSLMINALVSECLVSILKLLTVRPKYIVAKGGITSSDLASKGLLAEKALVLGPIIPGVPVWEMDALSKFPGIMYVVFPGNVGNDTALAEVCQKLNE